MKPKIWLYKDKATGSSKGEATVTYDDTNAAQSALSWFNGQGKKRVVKTMKRILKFRSFLQNSTVQGYKFRWPNGKTLGRTSVAEEDSEGEVEEEVNKNP
jgi:RNA recognition motif. (a.k.a. RRM, RBD, or RNP domain)